jgi:aldose 1-epimerase
MACETNGKSNESHHKMNIAKEKWGDYQGHDIWLYTITAKDIEIRLTNYGCTIISIRFKGNNVILGYASVDQLIADKYYMGCLVGRYAGRISNASFKIDETEYRLSANDGLTGNHLHGGVTGFNKKVFRETVPAIVDLASGAGKEQASITFTGSSEHLEEGYPGNVDLSITITLTSNNRITFSYLAIPDRPTHINLTHHLYYNLGGFGPGIESRVATDQYLFINANSIVQTGSNYIPTGDVMPVPAFADFRKPTKIPRDKNYNECYILDALAKNGMSAELANTGSGIKMELSTSCPAIIFYSGQFLDKPFGSQQGICLETQYLPDAPNHSNFPSTLYHPEKPYREQTTIHFKNII